MSHGERVVILNPDLVSSDVHEFLELLKCARTLDGIQAIEAYEAALELYDGDLLDAADMPNYRWMYDNAQIALPYGVTTNDYSGKLGYIWPTCSPRAMTTASCGRQSCTRACALKTLRMSGFGRACSGDMSAPGICWGFNAPNGSCGKHSWSSHQMVRTPTSTHSCCRQSLTVF